MFSQESAVGQVIVLGSVPVKGLRLDIAAMMRDMIKSSLTELPPPQSQSQSNSRDKDPSHDLEDSSEGEISDFYHHEDPELNQGNPELDQLVHTAEEQQDFDSFTQASPSVSLQRVRLPILKLRHRPRL